MRPKLTTLQRLPSIPSDEEGPVFKEPWEARVFGLAVQLADRGVFTWEEWTQALGREIEAAQVAGEPDLGDGYYHHWLNALERLVQRKGQASPGLLRERLRAWRRAHLLTPHGKAVRLEASRERPAGLD